MVSGTRVRLAGVALAMALVSTSPLSAQRCKLDDTAKKCLERYGWEDLVEWKEEELFKYRKAVQVAKAHTRHKKDSTNCNRVREGTLGALNVALSRQRNEFPPDRTPTYFFKGTAPPGAGGTQDEDAQYVGTRIKQDGDTLINRHIFAFDTDLMLNSERKREFFEMLQHEGGHYLGIEHEDTFNNYHAQECWVRDFEKEKPPATGGFVTVIIVTSERWECTYELDWDCWIRNGKMVCTEPRWVRIGCRRIF